MKAIVKYGTIIALAIISYGPATTNRSEFVFDDYVAIVRNSDVTNTSCTIIESIGKIVQHDFWGTNITSKGSHKSYRPLVTFMFNLEHRFIWNEFIAANMKRINLCLHCIICCLLYHLLPKIFNDIDQNVGWLATVLFAIHPVHTESVCGVVGRADLLCTIFYLISVWTYLNLLNDYTKHDFINVALKFTILIGLTGLSVMSKEVGITVLPLCAIYDILMNFKFNRSNTNNKSNNVNVIIRCSVLVLITVGLSLLRLMLMNYQSPKFKPADNPIAAAENHLTKALSQQFLYAVNFWILLCPDWLCFDWSFDSIRLVHSLDDIRVISIAIFYGFLIQAIVNGSRSVCIAISFLIIPFLPATGIIKLGFVIAERILYIPSIGYCLLICIGLNRIYRRYPMVCSGMFTFICITFVLRTNQRAKDWMNEDRLYRSAIRVCPNNAKIYYNIGRLLSHQDEPEMAMKYYKQAIRLYPNYDAALMNLGNLYRARNELDIAEKYIQRSLNITEEFPAAWMNLGIIKATKGNHKEALMCYKKAIKYRKNYDTCLYNLGNLYLDMKNFSLAMQTWKQSLAINPKQSRAWANALTLLDSEGKPDEVISLSTRALAHLPNDSSILFLRANAFGKLNQFERAEELYRRAISLQPNYALCHVNLGVLYHRWNKKSQAIESYRKALKLSPNLPNARKYLDQLVKAQRNKRN